MSNSSEPVEDYARMAAHWWDVKQAPHGPECPDLACADLRAALGLSSLNVAMPVTVAPKRALALTGGRS